MNLPALQSYMLDQRIDAWLIHDFRNSNPVLAQLLPPTPHPRHTTRRCNLLIPARGEPRALIHHLDRNALADVPPAFQRDTYITWQDYHRWLDTHLAGLTRVAMEYAPACTLPVVSMVDAGTVELVRSRGVEVVSSANVIQVSVATWSPDAVKQHDDASRKVAGVKDEAFDLIRRSLAAGKTITELDVQKHILARFDSLGLQYPDPPIVAVNAHAGDPHFEVSQTNPSPIRPGDWVLIDLWARIPGDHNIYSDITWVGFCGDAARLPKDRREVFNAVKAARDAAVSLAKDAFSQRRPLKGYMLDDASRHEMLSRGYGEFIRHRTGHSLSPGPKVHGIGVNLDNLETHDTRDVLPGIGFTVEPGLYLPDFGVRLEINVHVDPKSGPRVTSCIQDDILYLA